MPEKWQRQSQPHPTGCYTPWHSTEPCSPVLGRVAGTRSVGAFPFEWLPQEEELILFTSGLSNLVFQFGRQGITTESCWKQKHQRLASTPLLSLKRTKKALGHQAPPDTQLWI